MFIRIFCAPQKVEVITNEKKQRQSKHPMLFLREKHNVKLFCVDYNGLPSIASFGNLLTLLYHQVTNSTVDFQRKKR